MAVSAVVAGWGKMYNRRDKMHNDSRRVPGIINLGKGFYFVTDNRGDQNEVISQRETIFRRFCLIKIKPFVTAGWTIVFIKSHWHTTGRLCIEMPRIVTRDSSLSFVEFIIAR